jgi:hypothetical protein
MSSSDNTVPDAAWLLRSIASTKAELDGLAQQMGNDRRVRRVDHQFDCYGYTDDFPTAPKGIVKWWIDVETHSGDSRCGSLTLFWDVAAWQIEIKVTRPERDGPEDTVELPRFEASDVTGCITQLPRAVQTLITAVRAAIDELSGVAPAT